SFVTGALTATTITVFVLHVLPGGTYVVLPCDPTITARPIFHEDYLDLPPQHQQDLRALHTELESLTHSDADPEKRNPVPQKHDMGPWQTGTVPLDLSHTDKRKFSSLSGSLRLQLHQLLLKEQQRKIAHDTHQPRPQQHQQRELHNKDSLKQPAQHNDHQPEHNTIQEMQQQQQQLMTTGYKTQDLLGNGLPTSGNNR
ncbi:hypothetical protein OTU49_015026, partial [Cherax quadricarinatus]